MRSEINYLRTLANRSEQVDLLKRFSTFICLISSTRKGSFDGLMVGDSRCKPPCYWLESKFYLSLWDVFSGGRPPVIYPRYDGAETKLINSTKCQPVTGFLYIFVRYTKLNSNLIEFFKKLILQIPRAECKWLVIKIWVNDKHFCTSEL